MPEPHIREGFLAALPIVARLTRCGGTFLTCRYRAATIQRNLPPEGMTADRRLRFSQGVFFI